MEPIYFSSPGMLDALVELLRRRGHPTDAVQIVLGMNAPYICSSMKMTPISRVKGCISRAG